MIKDYLRLFRSSHWVKNLFLFAAPFFGGVFFREETMLNAIPVFIAFSLGASSVYIINDILDIKNDQAHPEKKKRPIASGRVSKGHAELISVALILISFVLSFSINAVYFYYVLGYFIIQIAYSAYLKNVPIMDIFSIASGFVIRVLAGGAAFNVTVSHWLLLTMFMISLVLASGKRLSEVGLLNKIADEHRKSLTFYSVSVLKQILLISASASLMSYALYTVEQYQSLIYTIPVVTIGLFRYIMLADSGAGDPTEALTKDKWLALTVLAWKSEAKRS